MLAYFLSIGLTCIALDVVCDPLTPAGRCLRLPQAHVPSVACQGSSNMYVLMSLMPRVYVLSQFLILEVSKALVYIY